MIKRNDDGGAYNCNIMNRKKKKISRERERDNIYI